MALPQKNVVSFPDRDINPKKKDEDYHRRWTQAIYSKFQKNRTMWGPGTQNYWDILRSYGDGRQDTDIYKSYLTGDSDDTDVFSATALGRVAKRKGFDDVAFNIVSPLPMVQNIVLSKLDNVDFDIHVDVIDEKHIQQEEEKKWETIFEANEKDFIDSFYKNLGLQPANKNLPQNEDEYELMIKSEGKKLSIAKSMQKILRFAVRDDGKWPDVIKKKIIKDFFTLGYGAISVAYDQEKKRFVPEYRDIRDVIIQYSKVNDFNDSEYAGYLRTEPISNLKLKRPDISEEKWKALAKQNMGYLGNPSDVLRFDSYYSIYDQYTGSFPYDEFKVTVFEGEWIDTDYYKSLAYKSIYGRTTYHRLDYDSEIKELSHKQKSKGASQKVFKVPKRVLRECKWIPGSDIVFDWGIVHMPGKPALRLKVEKIPGKSIVEQLIPIADEFMKAWLRHQDTMAKMFEEGKAINIGMLMNITDGKGKKIGWESLIEMYKKERILPYLLSLTGQYQGGDVSPIKNIPGGFGERLVETINHLNWCFQMIEQLTGINLVALGATPKPEIKVATTKWALQGTADALKSLITGTLELKENMAYALMRRIQVGLKNSEDIRKAYAGIVGTRELEALSTAEKDMVEYGMSLHYRPDAQYKERLMKFIEVALQPGRDGVPQLDIDDAMYFDEALSRGADPIEIRQQITYKIKQRRLQNVKEKMAYIDRQNQGLANINQQKAQNDAQLRQSEAELKAYEENLKAKNTMKEDRVKANQDIIMELLKNGQ